MEATTMTESDTTVVTEATWKPGLPPPIEALQAAFPAEAGYTVEYATWLERDQAKRERLATHPDRDRDHAGRAGDHLPPDQAAHALD
jgi:hypothetical protein